MLEKKDLELLSRVLLQPVLCGGEGHSNREHLKTAIYDVLARHQAAQDVKEGRTLVKGDWTILAGGKIRTWDTRTCNPWADALKEFGSRESKIASLGFKLLIGGGGLGAGFALGGQSEAAVVSGLVGLVGAGLISSRAATSLDLVGVSRIGALAMSHTSGGSTMINPLYVNIPPEELGLLEGAYHQAVRYNSYEALLMEITPSLRNPGTPEFRTLKNSLSGRADHSLVTEISDAVRENENFWTQFESERASL